MQLEEIIKEISEITGKKIHKANKIDTIYQINKFFELMELDIFQNNYYIIEAKDIQHFDAYNYKYVLFKGKDRLFFNYISKSIKSQLQNDIKNVCVICYENTYMLECCNVCVSQICIECFKKYTLTASIIVPFVEMNELIF